MLMGSLRLLSRDQNYSLELLQIMFSLNAKYETWCTMIPLCYQCQCCRNSQITASRDYPFWCKTFFPNKWKNIAPLFFFFRQISSYMVDTCGIFKWLWKENIEKFKIILLAGFAILCSVNEHNFIKCQKTVYQPYKVWCVSDVAQ